MRFKSQPDGPAQALLPPNPHVDSDLLDDDEKA